MNSAKGSNTIQPMAGGMLSQTLPKAPAKEMFTINAQTSSITPKLQSMTVAKQKQTRFIDLVYDHDFDENGVFYYLGSYGKKRPW